VNTGHAYVAPFRGGQAIGEREWVDIIDGEVRQWSPDGKLLYATSYRDGHRCIWAQRVNPATKHPVGAPFAVYHSHNARVSLANQGDLTLSLAGGKLVFTMGERNGNIWMAEFKPGPVGVIHTACSTHLLGREAAEKSSLSNFMQRCCPHNSGRRVAISETMVEQEFGNDKCLSTLLSRDKSGSPVV
jgi:hypothetical protein